MRHLWALAASTLLLAACGGGGGGGSSGSSEFVVDGVAAKGRISAGVAEALSVTTTGSTVLGTSTVANGVYQLRFSGPPSAPYVIRVTASAGATHFDESTQTNKPLPAGFQLRAAIVPPANGEIAVNVTPFTEMAVAAAARSQGGLASTDNIRQANTTVGTIIGVGSSLTSTPVVTLGAAVSPDEQRLAVMMTAVSEIVNDGGAGCTAGDVNCVVQALSTATGTSTLSLGSTVTAALTAAVQEVLQDNPSVDPAVVAPAILDCGSTGSCAAPTPVNDSVASAIAAAKTLFTELRSDITALFGDDSTTGALATQSDQFRATMKAAQAPADMVVRDTGVLHMGIQMWADLKSGRSTTLFHQESGDYLGTDASSSPAGARCRMYQDSAVSNPATSAANANFIGCAMPYHYNAATNTEWVHGFTITPPATATGTVFTYVSRANSRTVTTPPVNNSVSPLPAPSAGPAAGTVTAVFNGDGVLTSWTTQGSAPGAFKMGSNTLVSDKVNWNLAGSRTISGTATSSSTISGTATGLTAAGATVGTLVIKSATLTTVPSAGDATEAVPSSAALNIEYTVPAAGSTPGAQFEGTLTTGAFQDDASGQARIPTQVTMAGRLATVTPTSTSNFAQGTVTVAVTGFGAFNDSKPETSTNTFTISTTFTGSVTAPGRPQLLVTLSTSQKSVDDHPATSTVQYRSLDGSTVRMAINATVTFDSAGNPVVALSETSHALATTITQSGQHDVTANGTKIGVYDASTHTITFTDGSGISSL